MEVTTFEGYSPELEEFVRKVAREEFIQVTSARAKSDEEIIEEVEEVSEEPVTKELELICAEITLNGDMDKSTESTENITICHQCDKPMKLECGNSKTGTTQMWYCTKCHTFQVINPN